MGKHDENTIHNILSNINPKPDPSWVLKTRNQIISMQLNRDNENPNLFNFLFFGKMKIQNIAISALAVVALLSVGTFATVNAAKNSNPGDFLFGLNKQIENLQRNSISDPKSKVEFEQSILSKRTDALKKANDSQDLNKIKLAEDEAKEQEDNLAKSLDKCGDQCKDLESNKNEDNSLKENESSSSSSSSSKSEDNSGESSSESSENSESSHSSESEKSGNDDSKSSSSESSKSSESERGDD